METETRIILALSIIAVVISLMNVAYIYLNQQPNNSRDIYNLNDKSISQQNDIVTLQVDVANIKTSINSLKNTNVNVDGLQSDINNLERDVNAIVRCVNHNSYYDDFRDCINDRF